MKRLGMRREEHADRTRCTAPRAGSTAWPTRSSPTSGAPAGRRSTPSSAGASGGLRNAPGHHRVGAVLLEAHPLEEPHPAGVLGRVCRWHPATPPRGAGRTKLHQSVGGTGAATDRQQVDVQVGRPARVAELAGGRARRRTRRHGGVVARAREEPGGAEAPEEPVLPDRRPRCAPPRWGSRTRRRSRPGSRPAGRRRRRRRPTRLQVEVRRQVDLRQRGGGPTPGPGAPAPAASKGRPARPGRRRRTDGPRSGARAHPRGVRPLARGTARSPAGSGSVAVGGIALRVRQSARALSTPWRAAGGEPVGRR